MPSRTKGKSARPAAGSTKSGGRSGKRGGRSAKRVAASTRSTAGSTKATAESRRPRRKTGIGTRLIELGKSPLAQEMAAAAALAVAGVLVRNKTVRSGAEKLGEGARDAATGTVGIAKGIAAKVSGAVRRSQADHDEDRVPTRQPARPKPPNGEMPYIS